MGKYFLSHHQLLNPGQTFVTFSLSVVYNSGVLALPEVSPPCSTDLPGNEAVLDVVLDLVGTDRLCILVGSA